MLRSKAPAKLNLTLEALGRRADGYHDIASVIQAIDLADVLTMEPAPDLSLTCDRPSLEGPDNLAFKAAALLKERFAVRNGAHLHLEKAIPEAAGLGGGSSDAAAALRGLAKLWGLRPSPEEMLELAQALGSDVPFFLRGGTALAMGRGEKVTPLSPPRRAWAVVLRPPLSLERKTARMYAALSSDDFTRGQATSQLAQALEQGRTLEPSLFFNCFENIASRLFPDLESYKKQFLKAGAPWAHLAGSGPSLFTLFTDERPARAAWERLRKQGMEAYLAQTLPRAI